MPSLSTSTVAPLSLTRIDLYLADI